MLNPLITPTQAADYLGVHINTLRRYVHDGNLEAIRVGKHLRFEQSTLLDWKCANGTLPARPLSVGESFWTVKGDVVTLQAALMPHRWQNLYYEFLLSSFVANPDRQIAHLKTKLWWIPAMETELRSIAAKAGL